MYKMPYARKYTRKTYKKRNFRKRTTLNSKIARIAKTVALRQAETKHRINNYDWQTLYHNSSTRLTQNILQTGQGTNDGPTNSRIGDEIILRGLKLNFIFRHFYDRPNLTFKVWVLKGAYSNLGSTLPVKTGSMGNLLIDPVETQKCTVLANKTYKYNHGNYTKQDGDVAVSKEITYTRKIWIPFKNLKYSYDNNDGYHGKWFSVAVYVAAYDTYGTLITDQVGSIAATGEIFFKDP